MKKSLLLLLSIFIFIGILFGFISKPFANEKPKVVFVLKELNTQYWEIVEAGAKKGFRDFNIDGKVIAPSYGTGEKGQAHMLEEVLKEEPDVLVVAPTGASAVLSALQKFADHNIPILLLDTDIRWENKTSYIGTNNFDLGKKAGALLASNLQPGDEVALIAGDLSAPVIGDRIKGAKASLEAAGIQIAAQKSSLVNEPLPVKKATEAVLKNHPGVKGIYATTDIMALSVLEVVKERGYKIPVIGADGIIEMIESIESGTLKSTVAQNPYDMGYISAETALKVIKGEEVEKTIDTGVDIIVKENAKQKLEFLQRLLR